MTAEQRLDRLERVAKLFVAAGIRARRDMRHLDEKIGILVDAQIANEEKFAALADSQRRTDRRLDTAQLANEERFAALADSQRHTDEKLAALIDVVRGQNNGQQT